MHTKTITGNQYNATCALSSNSYVTLIGVVISWHRHHSNTDSNIDYIRDFMRYLY